MKKVDTGEVIHYIPSANEKNTIMDMEFFAILYSEAVGGDPAHYHIYAHYPSGRGLRRFDGNMHNTENDAVTSCESILTALGFTIA